MLKINLNIKRPPLKKCSSCLLEMCPMFSSKHETELQEIEKIKQVLFLKKGSKIFSEGNLNLGIYIIQSGLVKVYKSCPSRGQDLIFRFAKPCDIIDLASYQDEQNNVSAECLSESTIYFLETKLFSSFLSKFPGLALEFLPHASRELKATRDKALDIIYHPVESRLAHFLLYLKDADLGVYLSREEMAQAIGCSLETLIRLVSQFRKKGVIKIRNKELIIVDSDALLNLTRGRPDNGWQ